MAGYAAHNGGRFVAGRGGGRHPTRVIDSWEMIFVERGRLAMTVGGAGHDLGPGEGLFIAPGVRHGGARDYPRDLSFFWVHFLPVGRAGAAALRRRAGRFAAADPARLADYCRLFLAAQEQTPRDQTALDLVLQLILHESAKAPGAGAAGGAGAKEKGAPSPAAVRAGQIIALRFREPLSTAAIAAELHCNPDYLGRACHRYFGMSLTDKLNQVRLKHAAAMLTASGRFVEEIAYEVGFRDLAYFRRRFRREFAMTPGAYRRVRAGGHLNTE